MLGLFTLLCTSIPSLSFGSSPYPLNPQHSKFTLYPVPWILRNHHHHHLSIVTSTTAISQLPRILDIMHSTETAFSNSLTCLTLD